MGGGGEGRGGDGRSVGLNFGQLKSSGGWRVAGYGEEGDGMSFEGKESSGLGGCLIFIY